MQFSIQREALLKSLQQVVGVVERRQTLPVLANLLVRVSDETLSFTGTDLEVEIIARTEAENLEDGEITIPARKLFDIVRALPDGAYIELKQNGDRIALKAGRSRFTLATLRATDFPTMEANERFEKVSLPEKVLCNLMECTAFSMGNQDVRYYLNGMLLDLQEDTLRCVATDGHRLALKETGLKSALSARRQIIIPRKGVNELIGLLDCGDGSVDLEFGSNHLRVRKGQVLLTSKLIEGRFPDYEAVVPLGADKGATVDRMVLSGALQRAAILSNEKYRGVKLEFSVGKLRIVAHNPEQEEAVEEVDADTDVSDLTVGFNVGYLLDALGALEGEKARLSLRDAQSSCLVKEEHAEHSRHVIMPLRL